MREKIKRNNSFRKVHMSIKQFVEYPTEVFITDACFDCHTIPKAFSLLT